MRVVVYETAGTPPWWVWNRYGSKRIGAAVRVTRRRLLSVQWRLP